MAQRPNVIIVITDDQGYGDLGCHGNPHLRTPHLDRMARESVRLDDHHGDPLCSPSRAALLTGQYASRNGVWHVIHGRHLLSPSAVTAGDIFRANGYRTGMFGKWHLGDNYPFAPNDRGFERSVCLRGGGVGELPDYWGNNYNDDVYYADGEPRQHAGYCTDVFFDAALAFMANAGDEPFFVYLAPNAMHAPHIAPEACVAPYKDLGLPDERTKFYGMIANFDDNMGRLFDALHALDIADDTIVFFTADHGTAAGYVPATGDGFNAGMRGKKGSLYDGGHRVSCFVRWKNRLPAGQVVSSLSAHIDILPTLVALCQLEIPDNHAFDGRSLLPQIQGDDKSRSIVTQLQPDQPLKWHQCAVMRDRWRLIDGVALYDLDADPGQRNDIADENPLMVEALRRDYAAWWQDMQPSFAATVAIPIGGDQANPVTLSARDWHPTQGRVPWRQAWIDDPAYDANGYWLVDVVESGAYEFDMRVYPTEANLPAGICQARLRIGDKEATASVGESEPCARLRLNLRKGQARLDTWLLSSAGRERGAYYVYVSRIEDADDNDA